ncbi:hypothetical protein OJ967_25445 [Peribacillus frigoritolerans]|uniref:hypothetical protein n=1 Tax=Peribacillus frigoritolerans TaxID=450367 RepID=UPI002226E962|nr:hypothetical protein [Peribacillus frigoritolerans]UYY98657.1 hypothetical protein OJ967_25445 [Peribacillus frigoritolerans]
MSKVKKGRGRPATKYDEKEIYAIVNHYRKNVKPQGDIKYLQLYQYHLELHKERPDIYSRIYSEDFWRKRGQPGRAAIDTANQIRTVTLVDGNNNKKDIPNVVDVVNKYVKDPERLIKHLQPLENEVRRSIQKERELKQKNEDLQQQIKQEKENKRELREQVERLKECIFKLFHYSDKDGTPLENLLDMNNKNKRIKRALDEAFSNPQDFYTELESSQQQTINELTSKDNVVLLTDAKNKPNRTLADDFKGRF